VSPNLKKAHFFVAISISSGKFPNPLILGCCERQKNSEEKGGQEAQESCA
jgi:hypothetical protein